MRRHVLLVSLALAVALGGCAGLLGGGGGDVDPETVGERVDDRLASVDTLSGTVIWDGGTDESPPFRLAVTYERPDRIRIRFLNGSMAGTRIVSNGSVTYRYDPGENVVSVVEGPYVEDIEDLLFGAASLRNNATFEGNETLAGEDAVELSYAVEGSEVSLLLFGGDRTSQFSQSTNSSARMRVWLDTDQWLPRKTRVSLPMFRENRTLTIKYRNLTVNPAVSADQFSFDPPADARRLQGSRGAFRPPDGATVLENRSAAAARSPVAVPEPSVPARFALDTARVFDDTDHNLTGVELSYRDEWDLLEVVVLDQRPPFFDSGEQIRVAGRGALFVDHFEARIVEWQCSGTLRMVAGPPDIDRESLVSVAQSVGCSG